MSSFMMTVSAPAKVTSSPRVVLITGSPDTAALSAGVISWAGMSLVPPWLAVLLVTGYRRSTLSLSRENWVKTRTPCFTKETLWGF